MRMIVLLALLVASAIATREIRGQSPRFSIESNNDSLHVKFDEQSIATYYFHHDEVARPFFAHVRTPSGIQVTRNFPPIEGTDPTDHPTMHPGIWLAFANINGVNYWHNNDGKVLHDGFESKPKAGQAVRFATRERYVDASARDICRSVTRYEITKAPKGWTLSIDISIESNDELVFVVKEEMGLGMRVATPISVKAGSGAILSAAGGKDEKGTWGKHDHWWDYSGTINDRRVGMMLMSAPDNPPIWSHSRDYGLLVANPFPVDVKENRGTPTTVKSDEALRLRFGLLVYETSPESSIDHELALERFHRRADR